MAPRRTSVLLGLALATLGARARAAEPQPPEPIDRPPPAYPTNAEARRAAVLVTLKVLVDEHGHVEKVEVLQSGGKLFDDAAAGAVRRWTFRPAQRDGQPINAWIRVRVEFPPPEPSQTEASLEVTAAAARAERRPDPPKGDLGTTSNNVVVYGHAQSPSRGAGDYDVHIGALSHVPRRDAASLLTLAPGVFLSNEGGQGHPYQVFLRGFDAREGQDIEFTVDGVPVNEVGNVHGNGLADTHFILPELVESLRIIEGPFDPHQGNFAVAGSASYDLGLSNRGYHARYTRGSFGTERGVLLWGPEGHSPHTFGGVEVFRSKGFGSNRASQRASAMAGYEGRLGQTGSYHVLAQSYGTHYDQAGIVRVDDMQAGRVDFYGTYDPSQGGDSTRHSVSIRFSDQVGSTTLRQQTFLIRRGFRLRENYTGLLQDPVQTWQTTHGQRGDLIDQHVDATTLGMRASARTRGTVKGLPQSIELGAFGRLDSVDSTQARNRFGTNIPYRTDLDLSSNLANVGLYADASVKVASWLSVRGGLRTDSFHYDVHDRCALTSQVATSESQPDRECFTSDRAGYRSPDRRATTASSITQPRATLLFGPFDGVSFSVSRGRGARSIDPQYVAQGYDTPFVVVTATEGGVAYVGAVKDVEVSVRSVFFQTSVDKDLVFSPTEGRATLANGTTRTGWAGNARATHKHVDVSTSVTLVRAVFDDTRLDIPYVPRFVHRTDASANATLPVGKPLGKAVTGSVALGYSYVGGRPLPFGEVASPLSLLDAAARLDWDVVELSLSATNLAGKRYRMSEYNYVSDFGKQGSPTLVPARHYAAGEPRAVYVTLGVHWEEAASP